MGRYAHRPDQEIRKQMTPIVTPIENEIVGEYEKSYPSNFENYTGKLDANGKPVKNTKLYDMPDLEPEYEEEPANVDYDKITQLKNKINDEIDDFINVRINVEKAEKQLRNSYKERKSKN